MLFSMSFLPHQGRYLRVYNQARTLLEDGKEVTILAWDRDCCQPQEEEVDGIHVRRIWSRAGFQRGPSHVFNFLTFYGRLLPQLLRAEADVIHCFNLDTLLPGLTAARARGARAVLDLCEPNYYTNWSRKYRPLVRSIGLLERVFSRRFDAVLVHNRYQVRKFLSYGVKRLEQIGSYPNRSLIAEDIPPSSEDGRVVIGRLGSIYKNNGIEEMVKAFDRLVRVFPYTRLLLAGKVFAEFQGEFHRLIAPLGESVEVVGGFSPSQLPGLYRRTDISLQLSRKTDWFKDITPTKFFESLANGIPVVTSDIGDLREILEEYPCGLIVDETDPESIFSGLKRLMEEPALRRKMAENGLKAVKERYNWERMGERLLGVYRALEDSRS